MATVFSNTMGDTVKKIPTIFNENNRKDCRAQYMHFAFVVLGPEYL